MPSEAAVAAAGDRQPSAPLHTTLTTTPLPGTPLLLQSLTLAEKMQRWANIQRTARIMINPMATFAACGFAFAAAQCASYHNLGREDTLNGVVGGAAVGAVIGLKRASLAAAIGYGSLFAGGQWWE
jgi:hypothetical protein